MFTSLIFLEQEPFDYNWQNDVEAEAPIAQALQAERGHTSVFVVNVYGNVLEKWILPGGELNPGLPRDRRGY